MSAWFGVFVCVVCFETLVCDHSLLVSTVRLCVLFLLNPVRAYVFVNVYEDLHEFKIRCYTRVFANLVARCSIQYTFL